MTIRRKLHFIVSEPSSPILILTTDMRWCPRILPLHFDRRAARIESALTFSLIRNTSPLTRIMDVASKILVPLGMMISFDSDNCSNVASVALAARMFS